MNLSEEVLMGAAAVAVTLIGFSGVVTALRLPRDDSWSRSESAQLFALVAPSIVTLSCAFVPIGLGLILDDRDIMIFDEWAADQDSTFRHVFYENLLPALHSKGKTLIIITHDDRYFYCAQRLIRIEDGKLLTIHQHKPTAINKTAQVVAI